MFGTITVVDDELTESHELGSAVIGKAQGFYLASSLDGTSQTLSLTVLLDREHDHHDTLDDAISFFGVHRTASHASQIAVIGGTGKFEHAKGYAIVETLHNQNNQHITDGQDTILHFSEGICELVVSWCNNQTYQLKAKKNVFFTNLHALFLINIDNGVPLVNSNNINSVINPNTAPLLTGLGGAQTSTVIQNTNANSNDALSTNSLPFVTAGNLPPGAALQHLMFGTITVVDDELTESHELGSAVIGKAQGFYLASSLDGTSQTLSLTVLLDREHDHHDTLDDAISFFGVHRTASHASQIAVIGGTGKFEHAKGYAIVETLHNQNNQHITDGQDTILHFSVYLTYYKA
ncbi:hypothetical protein F2Q69_00010909 [Brassica cretica]|uniref:Dirigent protein n=1 Tax=Brassica cretica TaxID=69181 RepID=A0A8S9R1I9_BRACR|nr:hypothetical protein F2Q69_00010909 [Brassica cretica]